MCKRERWDRILAQVILFSTKFLLPPLSASLSAGGGVGYKGQDTHTHADTHTHDTNPTEKGQDTHLLRLVTGFFPDGDA